MLAAKSPTQQTAHTDHMSTCPFQTPVAPLPPPQGHVQLGDEDGGDGGAHHHPQAPGHRRHHGPPSLPSLHRSFSLKETNLRYDVPRLRGRLRNALSVKNRQLKLCSRDVISSDLAHTTCLIFSCDLFHTTRHIRLVTSHTTRQIRGSSKSGGRLLVGELRLKSAEGENFEKLSAKL